MTSRNRRRTKRRLTVLAVTAAAGLIAAPDQAPYSALAADAVLIGAWLSWRQMRRPTRKRPALRPRSALANRPTDVYTWRLNGQVLYVGISVCARQRAAQHAADGRSFVRMGARMVIEATYPTRAQALAAEAELIRAYRPPYCAQHNGGGRVRW